MNSLIKLEFEKKEIRTVTKSDGLWFVANDILDILEISKAHALDKLDENEKGVDTIQSLGGPQKMNIINESGLYGLTFVSRRPEAKKFRKWVTSEVLPSIRKHGAYVAPSISVEQINSLMGQLHNAKIESAHYKRLAELESEAVELWRAKSEYGSISPSNGLPRLQLRCGAWCATRNFNNSLTHDFDQMTFDFNK